MSATILNGKAAASGLRITIAEKITPMKQAHGLVPGLTVILVGDDPASQVYVRLKGKQSKEIGMTSVEHRLPAETTERDPGGVGPMTIACLLANTRTAFCRIHGLPEPVELAALRSKFAGMYH